MNTFHGPIRWTALPISPTHFPSRWELLPFGLAHRSIDSLCHCFRHLASLERRFKWQWRHELLLALVSSPIAVG